MFYRFIKLRESERLEARGTCHASRVTAARGAWTAGGCARGWDTCFALTATTRTSGPGELDTASGPIIRHRHIICLTLTKLLLLLFCKLSNVKWNHLLNFLQIQMEFESDDLLQLKWDNYGNSIIDSFKKFRSEETFCDVTLWTEKESLKCHKVILSASSSWFKRLLSRSQGTSCSSVHLSIFTEYPPILSGTLSHSCTSQNWQYLRRIYLSFLKWLQFLGSKA